MCHFKMKARIGTINALVKVSEQLIVAQVDLCKPKMANILHSEHLYESLNLIILDSSSLLFRLLLETQGALSHFLAAAGDEGRNCRSRHFQGQVSYGSTARN